jgi:hypothetical protein
MEEMLMSKTQRLSLIAALVFFSAFSLPRSSDAGSVSSAWIGVESFNTAVYRDGQLVSQSSGINVPAEMWITFTYPDLVYAQLSMADIYRDDFSVSGFVSNQSVTPNSASGFIFSYGGPSVAGANFEMSFQSIQPDGSVEGGYASAYMGFDVTNIGSTTRTVGSVWFQGQGLPEPSSLVLAATASLIILIFRWTRGFFLSRPPPPAPIPLD